MFTNEKNVPRPLNNHLISYTDVTVPCSQRKPDLSFLCEKLAWFLPSHVVYGVASLSARCRNGRKKMRSALNAKIVVFGARGLRKYCVVRDFKDKNECYLWVLQVSRSHHISDQHIWPSHGWVTLFHSSCVLHGRSCSKLVHVHLLYSVHPSGMSCLVLGHRLWMSRASHGLVWRSGWCRVKACRTIAELLWMCCLKRLERMSEVEPWLLLLLIVQWVILGSVVLVCLRLHRRGQNLTKIVRRCVRQARSARN